MSARLYPVLSIVLPTFNEAPNIIGLLETIDGVLRAVPHEIIVVDDDSPDGTWKIATEFSQRRAGIKVLRRIGKKGLSSAVVDGFDAAHGNILMVMDADGQHDPALLLRLVQTIENGADLSIGSRYVLGGSVGEWVADRRIISRLGTFFASRLSRVPVSDPLGGFFAMRTDLYRQIRSKLHPTGFKILLEILAAVPASTRLIEVPLVFRMRLHGQSKLSFAVQIEFICQILRLSYLRASHSFAFAGLLLFTLATILSAAIIIPRAFALRLLYTDASVRQSVQSALEKVSVKQGWLLSDIAITAVHANDIAIIHRDHVRTGASLRHCTITLPASELTCAD